MQQSIAGAFARLGGCIIYQKTAKGILLLYALT